MHFSLENLSDYVLEVETDAKPCNKLYRN